MITLLSPAKSLDFETKPVTAKHTEPRLLGESVGLIEVLRQLSVSDIAGLMSISDDLAALNAQRYADFALPFTRANAKQAVLAFSGDVYQGMDAAARFDARDFTEAQKTVRILSGLYGVLRPLDLMQPYRLEMGTRLRTERGATLYQWWGDRISELLAADLAESPGADVVVNLASEEYFGAVRPGVLGARIIAPRFEDTNARGKRSIVSFYAKRARGMMAGWLVANRVRTPRALTQFDEAGYRYDAASSAPDRPVFVRAYEDRPTA
ncbi:MAG: peroxide stress protein YaaA [Propioniciclava sp.]|uniref:peroxide stress protein YaaA n=1 Tax=Propioniciclava sp. TaxID=2038686 RepID=UPI0039E47604